MPPKFKSPAYIAAAWGSIIFSGLGMFIYLKRDIDQRRLVEMKKEAKDFRQKQWEAKRGLETAQSLGRGSPVLGANHGVLPKDTSSYEVDYSKEAGSSK